MAHLLPSDCLREIFKFMREISETAVEERKLLLSCLLVNRLWCETAVEILWRDPWRFGRFSRDQIYWKPLSRTIFSCLSKEQKELIKRNNISLSLTDKRPLFDYIPSIQFLSNDHIKKVVENILMTGVKCSDTLFHYNANILENELWKLFMKKCVTVRYLQLPNTPIVHFPGANQCLAALSEFECSAYAPIKLFLDLAQVCRNIKSMIIDPCGDDNDGLETLICLQNNLQHVRLHSIEDDKCQRIGEALKTQSKTLTSLYESSICIPSNIIAELNNLKSLSIMIDELDTDLDQLGLIELPNLEVLEIMSSAYQPLDLYTSLIKTTIGSLRKIVFKTFPPPSEVEIQPYIQTIINQCPNIEEITLWYIEEIYPDLEQLLSSSCDATSIFGLLIKKSSHNLAQLNLSGNWRFTVNDLEGFLKMWKGRKPLSLKLTCDVVITTTYMEVLDYFTSVGILKSWSQGWPEC
ncbi:3914_t:CDS:2 [Funneliformis caledonium]|uniref:3914_t:CDS:1 n=1 Tax=Funneliformis caledonium TaxID=1117310 RepID=A0A9N8ZWT9_9GLOM|nr:3914_t:CDS:2 [Funneliformis caledonium]